LINKKASKSMDVFEYKMPDLPCEKVVQSDSLE
jgi:hypothetical protein